MSKPAIGIVGGSGRIGQWFHRFFTVSGNSVLISGLDTEVTAEDLIKSCEVIILALPLTAAVAEAKRVAPLLAKDQLLMDLCSLKEEILEAMMSGSECEVVGAHPMFGPLAKSIKGQNVILCPGRGAKRLEWLERVLLEEGACVSRMDAQTHDRNMTIVQGITHLMTISTARMLQRLNITPQEALTFATPIFRIKLDLIGRLFTYDFEIIQALYSENRHFEEVFTLFGKTLEESGAKMQLGKEQAVAYMEEIQDFVAEFCDQAVEESDKLFDILYAD